MSNNINFSGLDNEELRAAIASGIDHGGNDIEPFVDEKGGWPLRCCLTDSRPGDTIAIIAWSPFAWKGPYREVGPVVVHAADCPGQEDGSDLPPALEQAPMVLRPYGHDRQIAYSLVRHIDSGGSLTAEVADMLENDKIDFVHGRNITGGCYSFTASRNS